MTAGGLGYSGPPIETGMRFAPNKRDANHKAITAHLRKFGVEVVEIFQPLDLLCHFKGYTALVEVKVATKKEMSTRKQLTFIAETKMPVAFVRTESEALAAMRCGYGLNQRQKDGIAAMLVKETKDFFTSKDVLTAITI